MILVHDVLAHGGSASYYTEDLAVFYKMQVKNGSTFFGEFFATDGLRPKTAVSSKVFYIKAVYSQN